MVVNANRLIEFADDLKFWMQVLAGAFTIWNLYPARQPTLSVFIDAG